ncbi:hypothetical protein N7501_005980 [Penicillium viridicatum]|nr:hypothetical protein N7501_005980 [Penicillium viridicatum]
MWATHAMELFLSHHFHECWEYASEEYPNNPPPSGVYREYVTPHSYFVLPPDRPQQNWRLQIWSTAGVYRVQLRGTVHTSKVILESDVNGGDRLLRGEIMTITDIMAARLRTKSLRPHIVAPILVMSLMGPRHARVLEADLDGEILNIRASRLYDFRRRNTDVVQFLTRYWIGGSCGQTMMKPS